MDQHDKAKVYLAVAALFFIINGYIKNNPAIPLLYGPLLNAITQIGTAYALVVGFVNYIANVGHDWTKDNIVKPVSRSVNFMTLACSDKDIGDVKRKLKELKEDMKTDKDFWDEFFG